MLRTYPLAHTAADTGGSLAVFTVGQYAVVIETGVPVMECLVRIHYRKHVRNADAFRAFVFLNTVAAGSARDQVQALEDITDFLDRFLPVEGIRNDVYYDSSIRRIPLYKRGEPFLRNYCAVWSKENANPYIQKFADILKEQFA